MSRDGYERWDRPAATARTPTRYDPRERPPVAPGSPGRRAVAAGLAAAQDAAYSRQGSHRRADPPADAAYGDGAYRDGGYADSGAGRRLRRRRLRRYDGYERQRLRR